jgi:hypothetical protein
MSPEPEPVENPEFLDREVQDEIKEEPATNDKKDLRNDATFIEACTRLGECLRCTWVSIARDSRCEVGRCGSNESGLYRIDYLDIRQVLEICEKAKTGI